MANSTKQVIYCVARAAGLFGLARRLTRKRLRILAYHGFSLRDEAEFRSKLFINPLTFERRLDILRHQGYRVTTLDQAFDELQRQQLAPDTVVITIDDGYASTLSVAAPLLYARGYPATVYLTSYHMQTQTPVFDLLVGYLIWKTQVPSVALSWPNNSATVVMPLDTSVAKDKAADAVIARGHAMQSEAERVALSRALASALHMDIDEVLAGEAFRLMTTAEAQAIRALGIEIGLHTHRHRFPPNDLEDCRREIADNMAYLTREIGVSPRHFCYPSGVYEAVQWPLLADAGLASATTCDTGLARNGDPPFGLRRFLDGEMVSEIEFEAEVSGFADILRGLMRVDRRLSGNMH